MVDERTKEDHNDSEFRRTVSGWPPYNISFWLLLVIVYTGVAYINCFKCFYTSSLCNTYATSDSMRMRTCASKIFAEWKYMNKKLHAQVHVASAFHNTRLHLMLHTMHASLINNEEFTLTKLTPNKYIEYLNLYGNRKISCPKSYSF